MDAINHLSAGLAIRPGVLFSSYRNSALFGHFLCAGAQN